MGKKTGFVEFQRQTPTAHHPAERTRHWQPFCRPLAEPQLREQAARCMDCGIPFCHTGVTLGGATSGCPLHNLIPEWNDLVYQGRWRQAYERLEKTNNFPEFTGLVCPAPCEAACTLGIVDPPVAIKSVEQAIIERAFKEGWVRPQIPSRRTGRRVAVVGSGPAGLACADQLNRVGHAVTVFERDDRPGGLLLYGIPNMKLAKEVVRRRIDLLVESGIFFHVSTEVGTDYPVGRLREEFDAVVLCTGATRPRDLALPGRELEGIYFAVDYLRASTRRLLHGQRPADFVSAEGKDVVVIGGGDTGTDCVATALRQGCRSLVQFEILPRPPATRPADNPWPQWPRIYRVDYGQAEAAARFGRDPRHFALMSTAFQGEAGHLVAVETVGAAWTANGNGRPRPVPIPGSERRWPAQLVLLALGFLGPEQSLPEQLGLARTPRSTIQAAYGDFATSVPGVFAAGDARRGQSLVVWAIQEGRGAARACDLYLMGETDLP